MRHPFYKAYLLYHVKADKTILKNAINIEKQTKINYYGKAYFTSIIAAAHCMVMIIWCFMLAQYRAIHG